MKKLDIHRDMPEPSVEDMEKHMNFEDVLNKATSSTPAPSKGIMKSWLIGGASAITVIVATILLTTQFTSTETSYKNVAMEGENIEKITSIDPIDEGNDFEITSVAEISASVEDTEKELSYDDHYPEVAPITIEYYEPKLVGSIPFKFDESFGLKEQWQEFPELSIYNNLVFQPIDKLQSSLLKVDWEKVKFSKDESGQYYLTLFKGDQAVFCAVAPVFEKEDFVNALEVYQGHQ